MGCSTGVKSLLWKLTIASENAEATGGWRRVPFVQAIAVSERYRKKIALCCVSLTRSAIRQWRTHTRQTFEWSLKRAWGQCENSLGTVSWPWFWCSVALTQSQHYISQMGHLPSNRWPCGGETIMGWAELNCELRVFVCVCLCLS